MVHLLLAAVSLVLVPPAPALAQSRGCIERPVGPGMDVTVLVPVPQPGARHAPTPRHPAGRDPAPRADPTQPAPLAAVTIPNQPIYGTECIAVAPPPRDILRGEPPPAGGLLRGDDGRGDLLRNTTPTRPPTGWR